MTFEAILKDKTKESKVIVLCLCFHELKELEVDRFCFLVYRLFISFYSIKHTLYAIRVLKINITPKVYNKNFTQTHENTINNKNK